MLSLCPDCKGHLWVCENHPALAWDTECSCGPGMPCPSCNPCDDETAPLDPPGFTDVENIQ